MPVTKEMRELFQIWFVLGIVMAFAFLWFEGYLSFGQPAPTIQPEPPGVSVYSPAPSAEPPNPPSGTDTTSTALPCVRGMGPDSDGDGIPDHCDLYYDRKDSDRDGLYDDEDSHPHNPDRDNDGRPDGWDRKPNESSYDERRRELERQDAQRREVQRQQEQREAQRQQAERDERRRQEREYQRRRDGY